MTHVTNLLMLAAEEAPAHEREGIDLILPALPELLWGTICFAVVAAFLTRIAFPKIRESVEKREQAIREANEAAEGARAEAQKELEEYKSRLADARGEANRIIEDARGQAEQVRKEIVAKAEREKEQIVGRAEEQIEAEKVRTMQELQATLGKLSIQLAEKVVGRSLDGSTQRELVDAYIKEVAGMGTAGNGNGNGNGARS
ncbi:MAG: F0F1 ATP synthase subunit B [Actinomycetota bacterium]